MAAVTCKYHTQTPARWRCNSCQINFCPSCVTATGDRPPDCPVCKRELTSLGSANLIKPFWTRLRHFFLYPLHPGPLLVMLFLTGASFLLKILPGWDYRMNFLLWRVPRNIIFALPFLFLFLKYAQSVLEDTARGHLKPRPLSSEQLTENGMIVVKMLTILIVFAFIEFTALDLFNQIGKHIVGFILAFATPAAIMVLAMEDKLLSALNPDVVASVIMRIGTPYFLLFVLFYMLQLARGTTFGLLAEVVDPSLWLAIYVFISMYFYLIAFNMMGYLLYQKHEVLGYNLDVDVEDVMDKPRKLQETQISPELRAVEILLHEGKNEEAIRQLESIIRNAPTDIEARERILKLSRLVGNLAVHREQGRTYISYLLSENRVSQAAIVYLACVEFDKQFRPAKAAERVEIGRYLRQNGKARQAMTLLNNLHRDFPSYENVPEAYLMVAQILCEQFNEDARARQVLNFILQNYPSHPMRSAVEDYMRIVDNVSSH
ncbi:MAG: B-box zinc finger protein [Gammaproteobacteria bacterium]